MFSETLSGKPADTTQTVTISGTYTISKWALAEAMVLSGVSLTKRDAYRKIKELQGKNFTVNLDDVLGTNRPEIILAGAILQAKKYFS